MLAIGCPSQAFSSPAKAPNRPNIILIYADDISARELPVYGSSVWSPPAGGDTHDPQYRAQTPALDKLAREGCWITTPWADVVCSPSRAMMMTGRFAHLHKWWDNTDRGVYQAPNGKFVTWPLYESSPVQLGQVAQQGGYATYWAGKTQMAGDLTRFGYDAGCFTPGGLEENDNLFTDFSMEFKVVDGKRTLFNTDTGKPIQSYLQHSWYWYPFVRLMNEPGQAKFSWWPNTPESKKAFGLGTYGPDVELEHIFRFMERQKAADRPFFIYHTSHLGHDAFDWLHPESGNKWPATPIVKWVGDHYVRTEPHITGDRGEYDTNGTITGPGIHNHVNYLDYQVWLYRRKLKELGLEDNTIIIFCADNGTSGYGKHSVDRQKGCHVPLIIYAPGMTKHGRQDVLVSIADFLPTIAELADTPIPVDYKINGQSLVPFLFTEQQTHREWLYAYLGSKQVIRSTHVMCDGNGKWWDVTKTPDDLISFPLIADWTKVSPAHRAERDQLNAILPRFDMHATEHDAPGVKAPPRNARKNAADDGE